MSYVKYGRDIFKNFNKLNEEFIKIYKFGEYSSKLKYKDLSNIKRSSYENNGKLLPKFSFNKQFFDDNKKINKFNYYVSYNSFVYWNILNKQKKSELIEIQSKINFDFCNSKLDKNINLLLPHKYFMPYPFKEDIVVMDDEILKFDLCWDIVIDGNKIGEVDQKFLFNDSICL